MSLVTVAKISKYFGSEQILDSVSFRIETGNHIGLIGSNGAGKSTLLRIVAGLDTPDSGSVSRASQIRVSYLPQELELHAQTSLYEALLEPFRDVIQAQERLQELEAQMSEGDDPALLNEYGRLQARVEQTGYDYRDRIQRTLVGLELGPECWDTPVDKLSGGQRTRANLGRTLLSNADVLLLDEPTNHLDIPALEWLESYLGELKRPFVIVAHDRYLLDRVTNRTLELSSGRLASYQASYSRYLELRQERLERQQREYEAQQEHIAKTEEFIRRYGAGQRHKEARGRQKRLNRLERLEGPAEEKQVHLHLKGTRRTGDMVLEARHLVAGYGGEPLVRLPEQVIIQRGDRVAMIGPNGSGKTTVLRTLCGSLSPVEGTVRWGARTSVGYLAQTADHLDSKKTLLEELQQTAPLGEEEARGYLGRFLFSEDDVFKSVGALSGGEKSRLALAKLILEDSNVLVLDEPTNHLDIVSREALRQVLVSFAGSLLFVSHDRYLIDTLAKELWVLDGGSLGRYQGNYSQFSSGEAKRLDAFESAKAAESEKIYRPADEWLHELGDKAAALASQLAEEAPTSAVSRLDEMVAGYEDVLNETEEAEREWNRWLRDEIPSSSG